MSKVRLLDYRMCYLFAVQKSRLHHCIWTLLSQINAVMWYCIGGYTCYTCSEHFFIEVSFTVVDLPESIIRTVVGRGVNRCHLSTTRGGCAAVICRARSAEAGDAGGGRDAKGGCLGDAKH